jgi:molybdenum cofactor guanylyltransferase
MTAPAPVYGLLLAGGASRRMQHDKALIDYHGEPQLLHAWRLLERFVERGFVSVRKDQQSEPLRARLPQIVDIHDSVGPAGGILAAQMAYPDVAWLVLACDLPLLDAATLQHLLDARDAGRNATAYASRNDGLPEPLCAIWEPSSHAALSAQVESGRNCPRKALINMNTLLLPPLVSDALDNINTPEELEQLHRRLGQPS